MPQRGTPRRPCPTLLRHKVHCRPSLSLHGFPNFSGNGLLDAFPLELHSVVSRKVFFLHKNLAFWINTLCVFSAFFIPSRSGKKLIMHNKYTYNFRFKSGTGARWACSTHQFSGCKAYLFIINDCISSVNGVHDHPPPNYKRTASGQYIKINYMKHSSIWWSLWELCVWFVGKNKPGARTVVRRCDLQYYGCTIATLMCALSHSTNGSCPISPFSIIYLSAQQPRHNNRIAKKYSWFCTN